MTQAYVMSVNIYYNICLCKTWASLTDPFIYAYIQDNNFVGLAYQGKDFVFRFIIEYSSLRDFGP
jgi:hypothetical protein